MGDGGGDIIVKSDSVDILFDDTIYKKNQNDPKRHENANRKITQVQILDDNGGSVFDSGDHQGGLKWTVKVLTK